MAAMKRRDEDIEKQIEEVSIWAAGRVGSVRASKTSGPEGRMSEYSQLASLASKKVLIFLDVGLRVYRFFWLSCGADQNPRTSLNFIP